MQLCLHSEEDYVEGDNKLFLNYVNNESYSISRFIFASDLVIQAVFFRTVTPCILACRSETFGRAYQ
jgi:hypothetical protein